MRLRPSMQSRCTEKRSIGTVPALQGSRQARPCPQQLLIINESSVSDMKIDKRALLGKGVFVERMTSISALMEMAKALRPVRTLYPLERFGAANDGGYLLPADLQGVGVCFSPGVGDLADFEKDILQRAGISSHLADGSVSSPPKSLNAKSFLRKYLGSHDSETHITLDSWMKSSEDLTAQADFLLQMDIEGSDYVSILATPDAQLKRFRIILLEIHDVEAWGSPAFFRIVKAFFEKILQHFVVVHNHPNNACGVVDLGGFVAPRVFELTFHRRDRVRPSGYASVFPHPLDRGNLTSTEDLVLPRNWWGPGRARQSAKVRLELQFLQQVSGVIHVGANAGHERDLYDRLGLPVLWVEAIPQLARRLRASLAGYPLQETIECLLADEDGKQYLFNVANNNGASSSIYEFALHKDVWPEVEFVGKMSLRSRTFQALVAERGLDMSRYEALVLDTQGSELLVMKGFGPLLDSMKFIWVEAADFEAYAGGCQLGQVSEYLSQRGFRDDVRVEIARHPDGGRYFDVLFVRR